MEELGMKGRALSLEDSKITYTILKMEGKATVNETIRKHVIEQSEYIDFIFAGNNGADFSSKDKNRYLGSVANTILRDTKLNMFFMV